MTEKVTAPHVYRAINAITATLAKAGIAKAHTNLQDQYTYRSIDDVIGRLAPLLAKHRLCALPRVLNRQATERTGEAGSLLVCVSVLVAYDLISCRDGSRHVIQAAGEALDASDKATSKALSAAYKSAMLQTFCVPGRGVEDPDASGHRLGKPMVETEPVQGWQTWSEDIIEIIRGCESHEALDLMRIRQAALLTAISREQPNLYAEIGAAFANRALGLAGSSQLRAHLPKSETGGREMTRGEAVDA